MVAPACIECGAPGKVGRRGGTNLTRGLCPRCYSAQLKASKPEAECVNCGRVKRIVARGICQTCSKRARRQKQAGHPVTVRMNAPNWSGSPPSVGRIDKPVDAPTQPATLQKPTPATDKRICVHLPVAGLDMWLILDPPGEVHQFEAIRAAIPKAGATALRWAKDRLCRASVKRARLP